ncbi:hypothetical protein D3C87_1561880 [compost metagenome]
MQVDLLACAKRQLGALQRSQLRGAVEHRNPAATNILTDADFALTDDHLAVSGLDRQRRDTRHRQRHLALHQFHVAARHIYVNGAGGIELQRTAIGQLHLLALARGGVQVGTPDLQR